MTTAIVAASPNELRTDVKQADTLGAIWPPVLRQLKHSLRCDGKKYGKS